MANGATKLMTIYSLTGSGARPWRGPDTSPSDYETAEGIFGPDARLRSAPTDLRQWEPKFFGSADWDPAAYTVTSDYSVPGHAPYTLTGVRTYFGSFLFAGDVLVLELRLHASLDGYILAQKEAFDRKASKQLAGEELLRAAASRVNGTERDQLIGLEFGQDKHQLIVLSLADTGLIFSAGDVGRSQQINGSKLASKAELALDFGQIDFAALTRLMFKDVPINYRPDLTPISFPNDINGPDRQMVAVWATNTVVCGIAAYDDYDNLGVRRIRELTVAAAQTVAAANRCREIRMATQSVLQHLNLPASSDQNPSRQRVELITYEHELHNLESDLAFGVDVYCGPALVRGGRPIERYQEAVRTESGFDSSVALTHRMLQHLTSIVAARRQIFEVTVSMEVSRSQADQLVALNEVSRRQADQVAALKELLNRTEGMKTASVVVASIAVIVSCIALFAALATVPVSTSAFMGPQFRSAAVAAASVIFAGLLGFLVYRASKASLSGNLRTLIFVVTLVLAALCPVGLGLAFWLSLHRGAAAHLYALVGGLAAGLATFVLVVWQVDFGGHNVGVPTTNAESADPEVEPRPN